MLTKVDIVRQLYEQTNKKIPMKELDVLVDKTFEIKPIAQFDSEEEAAKFVEQYGNILVKAALPEEEYYSSYDEILLKKIKLIDVIYSETYLHDMIDKTKNKIPEQFIQFYPFMVENFLKNYDKIKEFVESKKGVKNLETVQIYIMRVSIDYDGLLEKLVKTKEYVDTTNLKK